MPENKGLWSEKDLEIEEKTERIIIQPQNQSEAGFNIAVGIVLAAVISVGSWIGYLEFKQYQARQAAKQIVVEQNERNRLAAEAARQSQERARLQQAQREQARKEAAWKATAAYREKQTQCRFWQQQEESARKLEMVGKYCDQ